MGTAVSKVQMKLYLLKLLRPQQWYKNLLIFLPLIFVGKLFDLTALASITAGFFVLCGVSSANYIINDIRDRASDKKHPEKKFRPVASGKVSVPLAIVVALLLLTVSGAYAFTRGPLFLGAVLFLFAFTLVYTFFLKERLFLDILSIATNFVVRAVAGTFLINVKISPWLVLCTFFLSLYLSAGKRHAEVLYLGEQAGDVRSTFKYYTKELTTSLLTISTTLLIVSYSLYSFLSEHKNLLVTLPFALYVIFIYYSHIIAGDKIARHPEHVFTDYRMVIGMILWGILSIVLLYNPSLTTIFN